MRILLDTNVILDIFLDREPFVNDAGLIWKAHEEGRLTAYIYSYHAGKFVLRRPQAARTRDSYTGSLQVGRNTSCDDGQPECLGVRSVVGI